MKTLTEPVLLCLWLQLDCELRALGNKLFSPVNPLSLRSQLASSRLPEFTARKKQSLKSDA